MGDLFNEDGGLNTAVVDAMSPAELTLTVAQLELDLERAKDAYNADRGSEPRRPLKDAAKALSDLRGYLRACGEADGSRNPAAPIQFGGN